MINRKDHTQLTDLEFENQFADLTLDPHLFNHEAHLRLAWIHVKNYGINKSIETISKQIKAFATLHGEPDKFHVTVTVAAIRVVHHFMLNSNAGNFKEFINENTRLISEFKNLLDSHYSIDIFKSELAKNQFVLPDRLPFDTLE